MLNQGKWLIVGMVSLALAAAGFAWWWNYAASRHCLEFWGSAAALRIVGAPEAELLALGEPYEVGPEADLPTFNGERYAVLRQYQVSQSRGFGNVRRMLVQDRSFDWTATPVPSPHRWGFALRFSDEFGQSTVLLALHARLAALAGKSDTAVLDDGAAQVLATFVADHDVPTSAGAEKPVPRAEAGKTAP